MIEWWNDVRYPMFDISRERRAMSGERWAVNTDFHTKYQVQMTNDLKNDSMNK
ncbi:MAG: hypothetical protein QME52_01660 [Bacteroidota bacterium]|nr:hypothetical protein [Bacteroidota bacterium]